MKMLVLQTMRLESSFQFTPNWPKILIITMTSQFKDMMPSSVYFNVAVFPFLRLVTGLIFMSISLLDLEL